MRLHCRVHDTPRAEGGRSPCPPPAGATGSRGSICERRLAGSLSVFAPGSLVTTNRSLRYGVEDSRDGGWAYLGEMFRAIRVMLTWEDPTVPKAGKSRGELGSLCRVQPASVAGLSSPSLLLGEPPGALPSSPHPSAKGPVVPHTLHPPAAYGNRVQHGGRGQRLLSSG